MSTIQRINTGPRLSDSVVHNGTAYLAGKVPAKGLAGAREQTRNLLSTVDKLLAQAAAAV